VRLPRIRRPKIVCSPSYVDFRSRENTVILLNLDHTLRGEHIWKVWDRQKTQNVIVFDVPPAEELIQKP
jgi:hypothetical protein